MHNFANYQKTKYEITLRDFEECIRIAELKRNLQQQEIDMLLSQNQEPPKEEENESALSAKKQFVSRIPRTNRVKPSNFWNQPVEVPPTKIKIHHEFDNMLHFNHKVNVTIRNINAVIRLIFKNTKDQQAITAISPGSTLHQTQSMIDENRLREIQKIANTMKVGIPRRFDSKSAIREFI
jgi:hypothetical protein